MLILFFAGVILCLGLLLRRSFRSPKKPLARNLPWHAKARFSIKLGGMRLMVVLMGVIFILGCVPALKFLLKTGEFFATISFDGDPSASVISPIALTVLLIVLWLWGRKILRLCDRIARIRAGDEPPQKVVQTTKGMTP